MLILLSVKIVQWLIVIAAILFFIIPFIINRSIKAPEGAELPEKCHSCGIESCIVKNEPNSVKDKLREEIDKCEVEDEKK